MSDRQVTLVVSDLHIGAGDSLDDFVFDRRQFSTLIAEQTNSAEGRNGQIELIINGDFLEFAQVNQAAYSLGSAKFWCSEDESRWKLASILAGHPDVFAALADFQQAGNVCTIMAGNHDVDFYWGDVQSELRKHAGPVQFELGETWFSRYDGRLRISHGHMFDPANKFDSWKNPRRLGPHGILRLEMCPGTLFMVKFVNWLEGQYPFADNLNPNWRLYSVLRKAKDNWGLVLAASVLMRFVSRHPKSALGSDGAQDDLLKTGDRVAAVVKDNAEFRKQLAVLWQDVYEESVTADEIAQKLDTGDAVYQFMTDLLPKISPDRWLPVFNAARPPGTLAIAKAGKWKGREALQSLAANEWNGGAEIVTIGHTHEPDSVKDGKYRYYNTGSWTQFVNWSEDDSLTLDALRDGSKFHYQLAYLRIERSASGSLGSDFIVYDKQP